jgi:hypothetical protein
MITISRYGVVDFHYDVTTFWFQKHFELILGIARKTRPCMVCYCTLRITNFISPYLLGFWGLQMVFASHVVSNPCARPRIRVVALVPVAYTPPFGNTGSGRVGSPDLTEMCEECRRNTHARDIPPLDESGRRNQTNIWVKDVSQLVM